MTITAHRDDNCQTVQTFTTSGTTCPLKQCHTPDNQIFHITPVQTSDVAFCPEFMPF